MKRAIMPAMKTLVLLLCAVVVTGCAGSYMALTESATAYKTCLAKSDDCERERKMYEVDLATYRAGVSGQPGVMMMMPIGVPPPR